MSLDKQSSNCGMRRAGTRWQLSPADRQVGEAVCTMARLNQEKAWRGAEDAAEKCLPAPSVK
jgi:hypothetical protein